VYKKAFLTALYVIVLLLCASLSLSAGKYPLLNDYYSLVYGKYYQYSNSLLYQSNFSPNFALYGDKNEPLATEDPYLFDDKRDIPTELNLNGEIVLNTRYGKDFSLKKGAVTGAGSSGITNGLEYDLLTRILLYGSIADRIFVEFDYDSERDEEGITEETNIYSVVYKGREDEFVKEVSLGNKYHSINSNRYIQIDEGNEDSFSLRALAGWDQLYFEGLLRYEVAQEGKKQFSGYRKNVDMKVLDIDYAKRIFYFLPDKNINESSLLLYKTSTVNFDIFVDGKKFKLLQRSVDYDFDNTSGSIFLYDALGIDDELVVYYTKNSAAVGSGTLGDNAIIEDDGTRVNFRSGDFSNFAAYFDSTTTYLYLKKKAFNSYWELKNIYYLDELEGVSLYNIEIELLLTANNGINGSYGDLLKQFEIDTQRGIIKFNFDDGTDFYPRPFPGEDPFDSFAAPYPPLDPRNPFDPDNPVYGGINVPGTDKSVNTIHLQYSFSAESFFLDFNVIPGSVEVTVNGNVLSPEFYDVDYEFGIITFLEGAITPSSDIEVTYKYNPFGGGDKNLYTALGITYENDLLHAHNLTSYRTGVRGKEAPEVGNEKSRVLQNSTEFYINFGSPEKDTGVLATLSGGFALASTNKNAYGSAVIADMETDEYTFELDLNDDDWILASDSSKLPLLAVPVTLGSRGKLYYKNYYEEKTVSSDELKTLSWNIPQDQVFDYSEKAGPYNTADMPSGGNDESLVIDYEFSPGSTNSFVSVVAPVSQKNLEEFERFNIILQGNGITGDSIRIYAELIKIYNEDIDGDGKLDAETSINDRGFEIVPSKGSAKTVIGTDREGESNGRIDSEDLNGNDYLDPTGSSSEDGIVIPRSAGTDYIVALNTGTSSWRYHSFDILDLIKTRKDIFQYANAVRLTIVTASSPLPSGASGKVLINKLWFSGSSIVNNSTDQLTLTEVSVDEDPTVKDNAFSKSFSSIYEDLHGDSRYRDKNDHVEKILRVDFDASGVQLNQGSEASITRRFGVPVDLSFYEKYRMFLYLPSSQTIPADMSFTLSFISSVNERLEAIIPGSSIRNGWNEFDVSLEPPYEVEVNGTETANMVQTGSLSVLKRVSDIRFGFLADTGNITSTFQVWLDEWYVTESINFFDKAVFTEGNIEYMGPFLTLMEFPLIEHPFLTVGYERLEGTFFEDTDFKSDKYYGEVGSYFFNYLETGLSMSRENIVPIRNEEDLPNGLVTGGGSVNVAHFFGLDFRNPYVPVLSHNFERTYTEDSYIELTVNDYQYKSVDITNESLGFAEYINLPFGLSQSYSFSRNWSDDERATGSPSTSFILSTQESATMNQIHDILVSYSWISNIVSVNLAQDKTYTGLSVPHSDSYLDSYAYKLGTLFERPKNSLENAFLSTKIDALLFDISLPLERRLGFYFTFDTQFTQSNFLTDSDQRDTLNFNSIYLSLPFYLLSNGKVEMVPGLERWIEGDYRKVSDTIGEKDILLSSYEYLFRPPFFYISPIKGLGREKDYDAVDLYKNSDDIFGSTKNTLYNRYFLDTYLQYDQWYIPSSLGIYVTGETKRDGDTYTQKRSYEASVDKIIPLKDAAVSYDKSLGIGFTYKHEKNYSTKVLLNSFGIQTDLYLLETEYSGFLVHNYVTYTRERQKIGDEKLYLFPGEPEKETAVAEKPRSDTIENEIIFEYLWERELGRKKAFKRAFKKTPYKGLLLNTERVIIEDIYTFTDREKYGTFSNIPIRVTLEHISTYQMTELLEFGMNVLTVVGIEEKVDPPLTDGDILPSMGFEIGISARIIF
jgi:hypothetical protein